MVINPLGKERVIAHFHDIIETFFVLLLRQNRSASVFKNLQIGCDGVNSGACVWS